MSNNCCCKPDHHHLNDLALALQPQHTHTQHRAALELQTQRSFARRCYCCSSAPAVRYHQHASCAVLLAYWLQLLWRAAARCC